MFKASPALTGFVNSSRETDERVAMVPLWRSTPELGSIYAPLAAAYGYLIVCSLTGSWAVLKQSDGKPVFRSAVANAETIAFSPVIGNHRLFLGTQSAVYEFDLIRLNNSREVTETSNVIWRTRSPDESIASHLLYHGGKLIFATRMGPNSYLIVLDHESGESQEVEIEGKAANPIVMNDTVIVLTHTGAFVSFGLSTGQTRLQQLGTSLDIDVAPASWDNWLFFISTSNDLYGLQYDNINSLRRLCTVSQSKAYNMVTSPVGILLATAYGLRHFTFDGVLNFRSGETQQDGVFAAPAGTSDLFYVATGRGDVRAYDWSNGSMKDTQHVELGHVIWSSPVFASHTVFAASESGTVKAFRVN